MAATTITKQRKMNTNAVTIQSTAREKLKKKNRLT